MVNGISAILIYAADLDSSVHFYRDALGIQLSESVHAPEQRHFECEIGDVHFAIFPAEPATSTGRSKIALGLAVRSLDELLMHIRQFGIDPMYEPVKRGFALMTSLEDPDGNRVDITELTENWLQHLANRRASRES